MRTLGTMMALSVFWLPTACGGGGSGGESPGGGTGGPGNGGNPGGGNGRTIVSGGQCTSSSGQSCTGEADFETCVIGACGTQLSACFGDGISSGVVGGSCADYMNCELACPCDGTATTASSCETNCGEQYVSAQSPCGTCLQLLSSCMRLSGCTQPVCTGACKSMGALCTSSQECCGAMSCAGGVCGIQGTGKICENVWGATCTSNPGCCAPLRCNSGICEISTSGTGSCTGNCSCTCNGRYYVTGLIGGACSCSEACSRSGYGGSAVGTCS